MTMHGQLIGGTWNGSDDGRTLTVENPARREPIAEVPRSTSRDVDRAVAAAAAAFPAWRKVAPRSRGRALLRIAEAMDAASEMLGKIHAEGALQLPSPLPLHGILITDGPNQRGWRFYTFIGGGARFMFAWDADPARVDALARDIRAVSSGG